MKSNILALSLIFMMLMTSYSYAAVPPSNDVVGYETSTNQLVPINSSIIERGKKDINVNGFHNYGEQQIMTDYSGSKNDMSIYDIISYKTNKKYSKPKDDWNAFITAMTGGAVLMDSSVHAHIGQQELAEQYILINPDEEGGCVTKSELMVMYMDIKALKELDGNVSTEVPETEQEIIDAIKEESGAAESSIIYNTYTVGGTKWYVIYGEDNSDADEGFTKAMVAGAFGLRQDGSILTITLKNYDEIKSNQQKTKEERFAEMVPEVECIISTIK